MRSKTLLSHLFHAGLLLMSVWSCGPCYANTFTVTNTAPSGDGSLLWAVTQTQNHLGADTVAFDIPQTDAGFTGSYWRISLISPLPALLDGGTVIDGFTQASYQGDAIPVGLAIEIYGAACPKDVPALQIRSAGNVVRGLAIGGFPAAGISMAGTDAVHNVVTGCFIGTKADGVTLLANNLSGVECIDGAAHNRIGGLRESERNVLSGNGHYGIRLENSRSDTVWGNYVGVDVTGLVALPNGAFPRDQKSSGILVSRYARSNLIGSGSPAGRNILSGNYRSGLRITGAGADSNMVLGNYLGLGADGETAIANGEAGLVLGRTYLDSIDVGVVPSYNVIGGTQAGEANFISGNHSSGVQFARGSYGNTFTGNFVGTNGAGDRAIPNSHNGLYFYGNDVDGHPQGNSIGPANVICGVGFDTLGADWACISLNNSGTALNTIFDNFLGQNASGTLREGNYYGVLLQGGAHENTFRNNIITENIIHGVYVIQNTTINNRITQNHIFNNGDKAIRNEKGGNKLLPSPMISMADPTQVAGTALPNSMVEIYADEDSEARIYLGTTQANADGFFVWEGNIPEMHVTALTIDAEGSTSELSPGSIVPVELVSFTATAENSSTVSLRWHTASESNNLGFAVERRSHGGSFVQIAFIPGQGTTNQESWYEYHDRNLKPGAYTYRLRQTDTDGTTHALSEVNVRLVAPADHTLLQNYPNPFNGWTKLTLSIKTAGMVELEVFDTAGRRVRLLWRGQREAGSYQHAWDGLDDLGQALPSGQYLIRMLSPDGKLMRKCLLLR